MKEQIQKLYVDALNEDLPPNVFADQVLRLFDVMRGFLSEAEWKEIVTLDYVLTWRYTDDYDKDLKRYKELSAKRWGENLA
jgi:hypothetical protein